MGSAQGHPVDVDQDVPASRENSPSENDEDDSDDQMKVDRSSSSLSTAWSFAPKSQNTHTQPSTSMTRTLFTPMRTSPKKPRRHSKPKNVKANNMLIDMVQREAIILEVQAA